MRKQLLCLGCSLVGMVFLCGLAACSSSSGSHADAGAAADGGHPDADAGQACKAVASTSNYVLIDDMETTPHGPIQRDMGIAAPLTKGYWYNSGENYVSDGGAPSDMSNPPQGSFVFTALTSPTTTL